MSRKDFFNLTQRQKRRVILQKCKTISAHSTDQVCMVENDESNNNYIVQNETFEIQPHTVHLQRDMVNSVIDSDNSVDEDFLFHCEMTPPPEQSNTCSNTLQNDIKKWIVKYHISHNAVNDLIQILNANGHSMPADSRTLMNTHRDTFSGITQIANGRYFHFGLAESVRYSVKTHYKTCPNQLKFNINVDGLPIAKSSGSQFWPILGAIVDEFYTKPFMIGLFHGMTKPNDVDEFFKAFADEAREIFRSGLNINGKIVKIESNAIICDAPAKAFVCGIKYPTGYFSCTKCIQEGDFVENTVVFLEMNSALRTDDSSRRRLQPEHHSEKYRSELSVLESLNIGMVSQVPLDGLHLTDEGDTKHMIQFWVKGKMNIRLKPPALEEAESRNSLLRSYIPKEFASRPRKLLDIARWKATKLRLFSLYTGIVIMKGVLPSKLYKHFTCYCVALRILSNKEYLHLIDYADSLSKYFINKYIDYYGKKYISHNVHNLIHICDDVRRFGVIDSFCAYKFENYMYQIKQKLKVGSNPLEQIINRIGEELKIECESSVEEKIYPIIHFKKDKVTVGYLEFNGFTLSIKSPNNCCFLRDGNISVLQDIYLKESVVWVRVKQYTARKPFFATPCDSTIVGICIVSEQCLQLNKDCEATEILHKCLKAKLSADGSNYIIMKLLH